MYLRQELGIILVLRRCTDLPTCCARLHSSFSGLWNINMHLLSQLDFCVLFLSLLFSMNFPFSSLYLVVDSTEHCTNVILSLLCFVCDNWLWHCFIISDVWVWSSTSGMCCSRFMTSGSRNPHPFSIFCCGKAREHISPCNLYTL